MYQHYYPYVELRETRKLEEREEAAKGKSQDVIPLRLDVPKPKVPGSS